MNADACPGSLFIELWLNVEQYPPEERTLCGKPSTPACKEITAILRLEDGASAVSRLKSILAQAAANGQAQLAAAELEVMRQIDLEFLAIHPRSRHTPHGKRRMQQPWLTEALAQWVATGIYCEHRERRLIARGPLLRKVRDEAASSADAVADRYAALSVVTGSLSESGRHIDVAHKVVPVGGAEGVRLGGRDGKERIGFLPVAQDDVDVDIRPVWHGAVHFLEFRAAATLDVPDRLVSGLGIIGEADLVLAPELVVSETDADAVCAKLPGADVQARMLLAGSGHTAATDGNAMRWNEARVVNGAGVELWRQQKIWPASMRGDLANQLGAALPEDADYKEFNASGGTLTVVDVRSFGRCVVLICQDLTAQPLVVDLIRNYQPDWVLVPIMDTNLCEGRWAHRHALALSEYSRARFLMVTSTACARKLCADAEITMGLAVGPLQPDDTDDGRLCAPLVADTQSGIEYAVVEWGSACNKWKKSKVIAE